MAGTVQKIRIVIAIIVLFANSYLIAQTNETDTSKRLFYLAGEDSISSGGYLFGDGQKLGTLYFPFVYDMEGEGSIHPYISGSIGYGAAQHGVSKTWMKRYGLKLGGGIKYSTNDTYDLRMGGAYQSGHFSNGNGVNIHGYEFDAMYSYHPCFGQWEPYIQASVKYKNTLVATNRYSSIVGRLRAGVITHQHSLTCWSFLCV